MASLGPGLNQYHDEMSKKTAYKRRTLMDANSPTTPTDGPEGSDFQSVTATLEHLTGPARGTAMLLSGDAIDFSVDESHILHASTAINDQSGSSILARLHRAKDSYELETIEGNVVWINGERVAAKFLKPGDLIEFGEAGPLCRYNLYQDGMRIRKTVFEIFSDCIDYTRVSRKPLQTRFSKATQNLIRSLASQTTWLFRLTMVLILIALSIIAFQQFQSAKLLRAQIESGDLRLDEFANVLSRTREEALRPGDLNALRREFSEHIDTTADRVTALEELSEASARVIGSAAASVVFLQGAYGYRDKESGRMMRYLLNKEGSPALTPFNQPLLTLKGDGPVAERRFTGTAFIVSEQGALLTNRHVALPWESDTRIESMAERGLEPVMIKFIGYLPNKQEPFEVSLLAASEHADLAVMTCTEVAEDIPKLNLSDSGPALGDEVIVMGYPTGLRSMLAQTGSEFIDALDEEEKTDFWGIASQLSEQNFIHPLSSRGIIARVTRATVVYDAETTHGGSGGPVLNAKGQVVAVNAAIIPDYTGSNLGVPVQFVRELLELAGVKVSS
jgi:S1-C subfamily serine protease